MVKTSKNTKNHTFWQEPFRLIQPNLRKIDIKSLDVEKLVSEVKDYGANAILVNGGGIVAWYPTENPYQVVNEHMKGNYLKDVIEQARKFEMKVLVRMDVSKSFQHVLAENPDWFRRSESGEVVRHWEMLMTCPTGPYWEEYNFQVVEEMLRNYDIDGIFFNAFNYFRCHCERCKKAFFAYTGFRWPVNEDWDDPAWRAYVQYRYETHADYTRRLGEFIDRISPGTVLTIDTNITSDGYKGIQVSGWETSLMAKHTGCITSEAFNFYDRRFPRWIYWAGEEVKIGRHLNHTMIILNYSYSIFNRRATQPSTQIGYDLMQVAANGGSPSIALSGTFDQDDRSSLPIVKETMTFLEKHEQEYKKATPKADIAIMYSQRTADYYGRKDPSSWQNHYRGVYDMLVEGHLLFTVLHEGALLSEDLSNYKCLILPNVALLSEEEAAMIDRYVENGGKLLATYETGFYDEAGVLPSGTNVLKCLPRKWLSKSEDEGSYYKIEDKKIFKRFSEKDIVMYHGKFVKTKPIREGTFKKDWNVLPAIKNTTPEYAYWEEHGDEFGLHLMNYGKGEVSYLPSTIDRLYHDHGIVDYKSALLDILDYLIPEESVVTVVAPSSVELVVAEREEGGYLIHLLNATGQQGKPLSEVVALTDVRVTINEKVTKASSLVKEKELAVRTAGRGTEITVDSLGLYEVIVIS